MAASCPVKTSKEWKELTGSVTDTNAMMLFDKHDGNIVSAKVGRNEIYEEYGSIYGVMELQDKLPRPNSFIEYSLYLQKKGINVVIGNEISDFESTMGIKGYNPLEGNLKGIVVSEDNIERYTQRIYNDIGYAIEKAKNNGKKVLVYRTTKDGDIVVPLDNTLEFVDVGTDADIDLFEEYQSLIPSNISSLIEDQLDEDIKDFGEEPVQTIQHNAIILTTFDKLARELGVEYKVVSVDEAIEITKLAKDKFTKDSKEPGFFYKGKIYLIEGRVTENTALHEMSHFVIRAIRLQNKELFDNMFNEAIQTEEGRKIYDDIKNKSEADSTAEELKEEVLATLLKINPNKASKRFETHNNNIWYYIKQFFRKLFGGNKMNKISNLNRNTTLYELADMIQEGGIKTISSRGMELSDIVLYDGTVIKEKDAQLSKEEINTLKEIFKDAGTKLRSQLKNLNQGEALEYLKMCGLYDELQNIVRKQVPSKDNIINAVYKTLEGSVDDFEQKLNNFVEVCNSFARIARIMNDILDTEDIKLRSEDELNLVVMCQNILSAWKNVFDKEELRKVGTYQYDTYSNDTIKTLINSRLDNINKIIDSCEEKIYVIKQKCQIDVLEDVIDDISRDIDNNDRFKRILDPEIRMKMHPELRVKIEHEYYGMSYEEWLDYQPLLAMWREGKYNDMTDGQKSEFDRKTLLYAQGMKVDRDKIQLLLEDRMPDMGLLSAWMDEYINTQDFIVSSFQKFLKDHYTNALNKTSAFCNDMLDDIKGLLHQAGFREGDEFKLRDAVAFIDHVYTYNYKGFEKELNEFQKQLLQEGITQTKNPQEYEERMKQWRADHNIPKTMVKVWTLKNEFKDYRYYFDLAKKEMDIAADNFLANNTEDNHRIYVEKKDYFERIKRVFFEGDYTEEVYACDDMMRDDIGKEALFRRNEILSLMDDCARSFDEGFDFEEYKQLKKDLWRRYKLLMSDYNEDGSLKTGLDLEIAKRLREYRDVKMQFYNRITNTDSFESEYKRVCQRLSELYGYDTPEYNQHKIQWENENIVQKGSEKYNQILNDCNAILASKRGGNLEQEWKELMNIVAPFRNEDGSIDYVSMSAGTIDRVNELMDKIYSYNGLSEKEEAEYRMLIDIFIQNNDTFPTEEQQKRFDELESKKQQNELSDEEKEAYRRLNSIREKVASYDYLDELTSILFSNTSSLQRTVKNYMGNHISSKSVNEEFAENFLANTELINVLLKDKTFREWFNRCHNSKQYGNRTYYSRKYIYSRNKIRMTADMEYFSCTTVKDHMGKEQILPGVPNSAYDRLEVKPEYLNVKKIGVTNDNSGQVLPKSKEKMDEIPDEVFRKNGFEPSDRYKFINTEYYEMKAKGGTTFNLLEAIKKSYLTLQEDAEYGCKLWYDIPRYTKDNYEAIRSGSLFDRFKERFSNNTSAMGIDRMSYDKNTMNIVRIDYLDDDVVPNSPVRGLFNIDSDYVSPNILTNITRYAGSIYKYNELRQSWGFAKTLQETVETSKGNNTTKYGKFSKKFGGKKVKRGEQTLRSKLINNIIDTDFLGTYMAGNVNSKWARRIDQAFSEMSKLASFSFFAFDFYSSTKNYTGAKFQQLVESSGMQYYTPANLAKGDILATQAMGQVVKYYKANEHKPLLLQLGDAFDFIQGRTMQRMGKEFSNSHVRGVMDFNFPTSFRKWGEYQATYQLGYAVLLNHKLKHKDGSLHDMTDVYEIDADGKFVLKDGYDKRYSAQRVKYLVDENDTQESILDKNYIDKSDMHSVDKIFRNVNLESIKERRNEIDEKHQEALSTLEEKLNNGTITKEQYDSRLEKENDYYSNQLNLCTITIENTGFTTVKNRIQGLFNLSNGAYAKEDANYMSRTLIGKPLMCLKKYFVPMFANKYLPGSMNVVKIDGHNRIIFRPRINMALQTVRDPVYLGSVRALYELVRYREGFMSKQDKANLAKMFVEFFIVGFLSRWIIAALFGLNDDDDDLTEEELNALKTEKFKEMSSAATWWDIPDDFNFGGWLRQRAIVNLMLFRQEQQQFSTQPWMMWDVVMPRIVGAAPTVGNYASIANDIWDFTFGYSENNLRYSRDVGPYPWQKGPDTENDIEGQPKIFNKLFRIFGVNGNNLDNYQRYQSVKNAYRMRWN